LTAEYVEAARDEPETEEDKLLQENIKNFTEKFELESSKAEAFDKEVEKDEARLEAVLVASKLSDKSENLDSPKQNHQVSIS